MYTVYNYKKRKYSEVLALTQLTKITKAYTRQFAKYFHLILVSLMDQDVFFFKTKYE